MAVQKLPREATEPTDVARSKTLPPEVPPASVGGAGFTDAFGLAITFADSVSVATDDAAFALALAQTDTVDVQSEAVTLGFPAGVFVDSPDAPTDSKSFTMRVWLSGSAGAGVGTPANANGPNDNARAVLTTALAGAATEAMTSSLGISVPSGLVLTSVIYRGWFNAATTLATSVCGIKLTSIGALFADINIYAFSAIAGSDNRDTGNFTFDVLAAGVNTQAEIQSIQVVHETQDAVAGVTPAVMNVDAGCLEIFGAFT